MEEAYRKIVEHIFSTWSALKLAVEHSTGGSNSKQIAICTVDYITRYVISEQNDIEVDDIEDVLEDIMDQEFNMLCEDNSVKEISSLLYKFIKLLIEGNTVQCQIEYNNLPSRQNWLSDSCQPAHGNTDSATTSNTVEQSMEEDSEWKQVATNQPIENSVNKDCEWTQVKSRRKR